MPPAACSARADRDNAEGGGFDVPPFRLIRSRPGTLDPQLSRWLWLVKWLRAIPHYLVLLFLWIAFAALTVVAFFSIVFTGRYPRSIFQLNVGSCAGDRHICDCSREPRVWRDHRDPTGPLGV